MKVLWRSVALITSLFTQAFAAGGEILEGLQSQLERPASYVSSDIMTSNLRRLGEYGAHAIE